MEVQELFDICKQLAGSPPSAASLRHLHKLLSLTAAQGCRGQGGSFGNLFSQIDFVCNRLKIDPDDKMAIQTARRHAKGMEYWEHETGNQEQEKRQSEIMSEWLYDLRAVARFISFVFATAIPSALLSSLPAANRPKQKTLTINKQQIRCLVREFDAHTIVADTDNGEIRVDYGNTEQGRDFGYLQKILRGGMQLNLLDCHVDTNAMVVPGIIIVEPDFLVDISSLAACFTGYGHHPLLYTLNRLKPRPNSQATLLGNFAGVALDDIVSEMRDDKGRPATMQAMLRRALRQEPLRYLACPNFDAGKFKTESTRQVQNIREAVKLLSEHHSPFLLEPSFVCEKLGLQGRVDLMASDMSLLVEQKSGKNMKIERQSHDQHGLQLESHYVQLLLYYGILRYNFNKSERQVDNRLLYSHYPASQGLLIVNYYRSLFREALLLRNQIVATELLIARQGFKRIIPLLTPDIIYKGITRDEYFHHYILPDIQHIQTTLAGLNPLERTYFERMMTFVYREQLCQKLGCSETTLHHTAGATSDLWLMPADEKQETGNIHLGLRIDKLERSANDGGFDLITLSKATHAPQRSEALPTDVSEAVSAESSNFRQGDMVYLYQYKDTPDVRQSILYKGVLQEIADNRLLVRLNNGQQDDSVFAAKSSKPHRGSPLFWAVEHGNSDVGTAGSIRGLCLFAVAEPQRRALLLGQRTPTADNSLTLSKSYHPYLDNILLRIKQARDYFLLIGPPGTGKTSLALRFIVEEALPHHILLMAYTNRAVDEICAMLTDAGMDYLRIGNEASCDKRFRDHLVDKLTKGNCQLDKLREHIEETTIIVATTSMLLAQPYIFQLKHFALAVVDEASQILEPGLIGLLSSSQIDRFVLIGDHKQLPAVVQQSEADARVDEPCLHQIGITDCRQSLFQRLYRWELSQHRTQFVGQLDHQGRMHPDVASFASQHFYGGWLRPVPTAHQQEQQLNYTAPAIDKLDQLLKRHRVLFLPVKPDFPSYDTSAQANKEEARLVADLLRRIQRFYANQFNPQKTVGVIVPYRNQIAAIRQAIADLAEQHPACKDLLAVSIDTVERYQGSQREVIIYSFTVSRLYQLDFLTASTYNEDNEMTIDRKLNVALTRARCQTLMVGNPDVLRHNPLFRQLMERYTIERLSM